MKPHRVSMEQEIALHRVSGEEEIMLWKVLSITRKQLPFDFYFTVSVGSRKLCFRRSHEYHKTTPFLFLCVFWGISPSRRRTLGHYYVRAAPSILCVPRFHFQWEYFFFYQMRKKQGNKKRVVYTRGSSNTRAFSWGSRITIPLGLHTLQSTPRSGEHTRMATSLYKKMIVLRRLVWVYIIFVCTIVCTILVASSDFRAT